MDMRYHFNKMFSHIKLGVLALGLLSPLASQAFVIDSSTSTADVFQVDYLLTNGSTDPNTNTNNTGYDLTASVFISMIAFDTATDSISLQLTVNNTTAVWDGTGSDPKIGLQKLAFGTDPEAVGVMWADGVGTDDFNVASISPGPELSLGNTLSLDVVSKTGNGANNILRAGESDTFVLTISFDDLPDVGVIFNPFSSKWQTDPDSFEFGGTDPNPGPGPDPGPSIPEPTPLALIGLGALLLRWSSRKAKT